MNNISSGNVFSPPPMPLDLSALSGKESSPFSTQSGADSQAINFGQNGGAGTDFNSLLGDDMQQEIEQQFNAAMMQSFAQLFGQFIQALMPMAQQMINNQQSGGGNGAAGGNSSGGAATPQVAAQPDAQSVPQSGTSAEAGATTASNQLANGATGLHLPESLKPYETDIKNAADKTGVPAQVLAAQIWQESRGNLGASTVNGGNGLTDSGLMQLNSNTFADLKSKNPDLLGASASPNNPADNIMAGALYMKEQSEAFGGNLGAALRAYNSGPNNVNVNDLSDISKAGTGDATYVSKVMEFANIIGTGQGTLPA